MKPTQQHATKDRGIGPSTVNHNIILEIDSNIAKIIKTLTLKPTQLNNN